ncbi:DUF3093 domain-containing protein [Gulosibacter sp. 10]|uniref:DUF3093 domain-containing protein n=1 Tax=Gulosibacter sp. 10 TaxID=1255570 RepID=UPI00097E78B8|nr:DUF3093 domain-containing protein [Gulosibacter sp. 10]SJM65786.1 Membrane protein [Gulosibacter sp. 10]
MIYRERVAPSIWVYIFGALIVPAIIIVFMPINRAVGIILGIAVFLGFCVALYSGSPTIEVTSTTLRVGSAQVPLHYLGAASAYPTAEASRAQTGPRLDARAWTCLRGWVSTTARVEIVDERDPIPYWLFSTRHPEQVVRAIDEAKSRLDS